MMRLVTGAAILVAAAAGMVFMSQPWSGSAKPLSDARDEQALAKNTSGDAFAADRDNGFDAERAMGYLKRICAIGPRISGTPGMQKQQELLQKHFADRGGKVEFHRFSARQRSRKQAVDMTNMIVSWHPDRARRVILCCHYDTRPIADQEKDRRKWTEPFLSANDGGSGVALMMELANQMKDLKTGVGVDFVFFDGEEYIYDPREDGDRYFFGSDHFAQDYKKTRPKHRYIGAVLLDMIAGKEPHFPVERNSWLSAASLVRDLWKIAEQEKCGAFENQLGAYPVRDDHLALNSVRIPAVDIVDMEYPHWHRLSDEPENCSGDSMGQVARVLITWLGRVK
ncbi:MAG TPA: M28 family peptidase [Gemmataceae bacterium]|jgi:hypothetical protein|nr:M28 family peptidase [Gemmataceae bacterium]